MNCGNLPDPVNGNVSTPGGTTFESLAEYRCNEGYKLSYPAGRTCLSSGLWSETAPRCEPEPFCGKLGMYPTVVIGTCVCVTSNDYVIILCLKHQKNFILLITKYIYLLFLN